MASKDMAWYKKMRGLWWGIGTAVIGGCMNVTPRLSTPAQDPQPAESVASISERDSTSHRSVVLANSPALYFPFEGDGEGTARDLSGNGLVGEFRGNYAIGNQAGWIPTKCE